MLTRTFLINVKPTKKTTPAQDNEKTQSSTQSTVQDSKYRIETPPAAVSAFAHRLGLNQLKDQTLIMRIITHSSYEKVGIATNERLDFLGAKVLDMFVLEYLHTKYPKMPTNMLQDAVSTYTKSNTLALMAKEFGVEDVARWIRSKPELENQLAFNTVKASIVRATVGALYVDQGLIKAREFIHAHFLSRELNIVQLLEIEEPKRYLSFLMKRLNREKPSKAPVFIVGVYSGTEKIGEGFGSSLKMAEFRANKDALTKYYLEEQKDFGLPSDVEVLGATYTPSKVGDTPVVV
ncbi:hypothetical protein BGX24_010094 [Mortierella sp. AD032]|nr:hypothetical protein BGX24_010094 [Mortierella sp. AD032]